MKIKLGKTEQIHFTGIGGIGMSGLALIMKELGFRVQGSDISLNKNIERLKKNRIRVFIGHKISNLDKTTILVKSSAIKKNNSEILFSKRKKIPIYSRGDMLGHVVSLMKNIVVAGSHGKTTTTSLISNIFSTAKIDPTVINGGVLNSFGNSAKLGKSNWCILESDESDGSFLKIPPTYSIVTNIDKEHLDFYKSMNNLKSKFVKFIEKTPSFGKSFICLDNKNNREILRNVKNINYNTYGFHKNSNFQIINVIKKKELSLFDLKIKTPESKPRFIRKITVPTIGMHNIRNATAAIAVATSVGITNDIIKKSLSNFKGVQRRFTKIFNYRNIPFFDDYAHHPTEIKSVLKSMKKISAERKIISVFQPHRYSRLKLLKNEFASSFQDSNVVILCPVFSAGEKIDKNYDTFKFADLISKKSNVQVITVENQKDLKNFFKKNLISNELVLCMGAGSISKWIREMEL